MARRCPDYASGQHRYRWAGYDADRLRDVLACSCGERTHGLSDEVRLRAGLAR